MPRVPLQSSGAYYNHICDADKSRSLRSLPPIALSPLNAATIERFDPIPPEALLRTRGRAERSPTLSLHRLADLPRTLT